jgi:signal peptidase I
MKKSVLRRVGGIFGYLLIIVIAVVLCFVLVSNVRGNITFIGGRTAMWVMTPSMEPVIPERSYILVKQAAADEVQVGDVLVFRSDDPALQGACNTHRVVEIIGDHAEFVTKGDNNPGNDQQTAKAANVVGIYEKNLPILSTFGRFLSSGVGIVIAGTLVFVILMLMYVPDMIRARRQKEADLQQAHEARINELVKAELEHLQAQSAGESPANADEPTDADKPTDAGES